MNIETAQKVVGSMKGVDKIVQQIDSLLLARKTAVSEHQKLRSAYLTSSWDHTNLKYGEFVSAIFERALSDDENFRESWAPCEIFEKGISRILAEKGIFSGLEKWVNAQIKTRRPEA